MRKMFVSAISLAACVMLGGCATTQAQSQDSDLSAALAKMMAGESNVSGATLEQELAKAAEHPLGNKDNPVRAQGPMGQRAYLSRLRCSDLSAPEFGRRGSVGASRYGNIMDVYQVTCTDSEPAESEIYMDMYHSGHVEDRAVPGFGISGGVAEE